MKDTAMTIPARADPTLTTTSTQQSLGIQLGFWLTGSVVVNGVLSLAVAWLVLQGTPVHFVNGSGTGESRPGHLADAYVLKETSAIIRDRYTWTYEDIDYAHALFKERLHPARLKDFELDVAPAEKKLVRADKMASGIVIVTREVTEREGYKRIVVLQTIRHLYVGATLRHQDLTITVTLAPIVEDGEVQGLRVWDVVDSQPLKAVKGPAR
jgi:hypothetical protein